MSLVSLERLMFCYLWLLMLNALNKNGKKNPWKKAEAFPPIEFWKSMHVHFISESSAELYWKALNKALAFLGLCKTEIWKSIFRRSVRDIFRNYSRSCCRQQSHSPVRVVVLSGSITKSLTKFRKVIIRADCDQLWVQALACFCSLSLHFGL